MSNLKINQQGQIVIILLLVMVVSLAVGLSVVGRSISDVSNSTVSETSSRAFSAAEAGLERVLQNSDSLGSSGTTSINFDNTSTSNVNWTKDLPSDGMAIEFPPIDKSTVAQVWLANPTWAGSPEPNGVPVDNYNGRWVYVDFGDSDPSKYSGGKDQEMPAIEINYISWNGSQYVSQRFFYDSNATRQLTNGFTLCSAGAPVGSTTLGTNRSFLCRAQVDLGFINAAVMLRIRLLYTNLSHPIAVEPNPPYNLPPQASKYAAQGNSGQTQHNLTVFKEEKMLPFFFDYALFSAGNIEK